MPIPKIKTGNRKGQERCRNNNGQLRRINSSRGKPRKGGKNG